MNFKITNTPSMMTLRNMSKIQQVQSRELVRLASGDKIEQAGYDPSGLAISEVLKSDIRSMGQAYRNANDGISLIQVAEGNLNTINDLGIRLKELAIQSSNDTLSDKDRRLANLEFQNLFQEIKKISHSSDFNGIEVFNGKNNNHGIHIGIGHNPEIDGLKFDLGKFLKPNKELSISGTSISTTKQARDTLDKIDSFMNEIHNGKTYLGALQGRLESTAGNLSIRKGETQAVRSKMRDTDIAESSGLKMKADIIHEASRAVLTQTSNLQSGIKSLL